MDGTPHLLTDVKFSERRRGYDPEEVDNFLERVSGAVAQLQDKLREATARAEDADARVAEAQRAQAAAEAELSQTDSTPAAAITTPAIDRDPEADADKASKILLMAQKTADATIDDANETAQQAIADARVKATTLVSDAESDAEKLRADAKREANALVEDRRAAIVREVQELEELKTAVRSDIDILGAHVDEQRARIRRGVEALALVLDDPDGLRVDTPPQIEERSAVAELTETDSTDGAELADTADNAEIEAAIEAEAEVDEIEAETDATGPAGLVTHDEVVVLDEGIDVSGVDLTAAPEPARTTGGIFGAASQSSVSASSDASAEPDIDLANRELFSAREEAGGPPTQQFKPFAESDDPLGPADDEADKAMRAFFEADFETSDPEEQKSRFGFRR